MNDPQIFDRAKYDQLRSGLERINRLIPVMDKAEKCGINCEGFRGVADHLRTQLEAIEREFMTPPPQR